ncbi:MAG: acyl--CoA ligase [Chloroflexi bacterium]|nr:acyl--CoA ligase [Chloroflexota bacterium]
MIHTRMTLAEAFQHVADRQPRKEALLCGEARLTYGQLAQKVDSLAYGLATLGIGPGDNVALLLGNSPEFVIAFFALARIGAVSVPLNPQSRRRQLDHILRECEPAAVVTSDSPGMSEALQTVRDVQQAVPALRYLIFTEGGTEADLRLDALMAATPPASFSPPNVAPEDLLALIYTSGTTGMPKGAMHSHRGLIAPVVASITLREMWLKIPTPKTAARMVKVLARYGPRLLQAVGRQQIFLSTVGCHAIAGLEAMLQGLLMGDKLILMSRFHPLEALQLIERERVTVLIAVPMALTVLMRVKDLERYDTSSLIICGTGSAPCPAELARDIRERFGCAVHIGFGTTELAGGVSATSIEDTDERQAETVGQAMPGMELKIVDEQGLEVERGEVGELVCRGESVMLGYYRAPEATAEVVDGDGWYHTGDLAVMDEQGYLRIVGRKKDMIIRGGQNIYPAEIESYLLGHQAIREAAVVGVHAAIGGEEVWAFLILEDGATMTAQEMLEYCRVGLEAYKIPHQVRFVRDFPRSALDKPQKFKLREMALESRQGNR